MPIHYRSDDKPVVEFDPQVEISPFALFRRLREGQAPRLLDIRPQPTAVTLQGAEPLSVGDWQPGEDEEILLFDDDGVEAVARVRRLQAQGFENVRALFGGLQLYRFSLDPEVVGDETFLIPVSAGR